MFKKISTLLLIGVAGSIALAAEHPNLPAILGSEYANAKFEEIGHADLNGVTIKQYRVTDPFGRSYAVLTDRGDWILAGRPQDPHRVIPAAVRDVFDHVFRAKPERVVEFTETNYLVDLDTGGHIGRVIIDAAGRIRGMKSPRQLKFHEEMVALDEGRNAVVAQKIRQQVKDNYGADSKIEIISPDPELEYVFNVVFTDGKGRHCEITTDTTDISSKRMQVSPESLPEPVMATVNQMFKSDKIFRTMKHTSYYYHVLDATPSGEQVALNIGVNGQVLEIHTGGARGGD